MSYKIIRFNQRVGNKIIRRGLTLEEAQAHCEDPETSSRTCTKPAGKRRTARNGPWFEGYALEKP